MSNQVYITFTKFTTIKLHENRSMIDDDENEIEYGMRAGDNYANDYTDMLNEDEMIALIAAGPSAIVKRVTEISDEMSNMIVEAKNNGSSVFINKVHVPWNDIELG